MKKIMYSMLAFMMAAFTFTSCEDVPAPYGLPNGGTEGGGTILPEGTFLDADFTNSLGKFKSMSAEGDGSIQWKINYSSACITGYDKWDGADTKSNKAGVTYLVSPEVDLTNATEAHVELNQALKYERADINTNNSLLITDNYTGDVKTTTWTQMPYNTDGLNDASTKEFVFVTNAANIPAEFMGKKVVIALRHTCSDSQSSTWEVKTLKVLAGKANVTVPDTPVTPDTPSANPQGKGTADDPFNVDAALKYITDGGDATTEVYIKGKISKVVKYNANYKNINYNIVDEKSGQELQVYAGLGLNGADFKALTDLKVGQVVVICGKLTTYMGTKQVDKNSKIISITGEGEAPAPDETVGDLTAPNGNFEAWVNGQPNNWATASSAGNATLAQSKDAHSGKFAVEVTHEASKNKRIGYKEIALKAGEYTVTFYVKGTAGTTAVRPGMVKVVDNVADKNYNYGDYVNDIPNTEWKEVTQKLTITEDGLYCFVIMIPMKAASNALIDDFKVTFGGTAIIK